MNPDVPERERTPVPKRRWRPLDEPDRRSMQYQLQADVGTAMPSFDTQVAWSGH
jgi:hypothetical protein